MAAAGGQQRLAYRVRLAPETDAGAAISGILPPLTFTEALETTKVHSGCGFLPKGVGLKSQNSPLWHRTIRFPMPAYSGEAAAHHVRAKSVSPTMEFYFSMNYQRVSSCSCAGTG